MSEQKRQKVAANCHFLAKVKNDGIFRISAYNYRKVQHNLHIIRKFYEQKRNIIPGFYTSLEFDPLLKYGSVRGLNIKPQVMISRFVLSSL